MEWKMKLPKDVSYIIKTLEMHGYEGFAVGGCVRDALLGREPEDWDITTSATPDEVKACFKRTIDTGIEHGTVTVMIDKEGYEVTTYRIDGEYKDSRHPEQVEFTSNLKLDLERRDFTINAMAYNETVGLVDAFSGIEDLEKGIIRCVGDAGKRFEEDALRMLRAVRFSGQLGFAIEEKTMEAITERAQNLKKISAERIRVEMDKLLMSPHPEQIYEAYKSGMTNIFLPEFDQMVEVEQKNPHHIYTVGKHCVESVRRIHQLIEKSEKEYTKQEKSILSFTMLLHDIGKPACKTVDENGIGHFYGHAPVSKKIAEEILHRLTFDNFRKDKICHLVLYHDAEAETNKRSVRRLAAKIGAGDMEYFFLVKEADILAQSEKDREQKLEKLASIKKIFHEIENDKDALTIKQLDVNGKDILELGIKPGKEVGELLSWLLENVLDEPSYNERGKLLEMVKEKLAAK